jgi:hypothetical protein
MADTKQSKGDRTRANQEAAGIPDSKPFAAPHAEPTGETRMLNSHINGVLISELNLPPHVVGALDWNATDEGIAEAALNPNLRPASGITVGAGPFEKALQQRRDDVKVRDMDLWESRDPLKEVADQYAQPGMRSKYLSAARIKDSGGTGDYEVVKTDAGDPVRVKGMILSHIPEDKAKAQQRRYQERGNQLLKQIGETYKREGGATAVSDQ